jgi:outer membrane protein, multidrug efflux system
MPGGATGRVMVNATSCHCAPPRQCREPRQSALTTFFPPLATRLAWPRAALRTGAGALALALTGCASLLVTPSTDLSQVPVPAAWSNATAAPSPAALAGWWLRFHDPQLAALVTQALEANNDVRTAQAALRQSRAQRDVAAAGLLPTVNAGASAQRSKAGDNDPVNSYQAGFDASWEPDIFGGSGSAAAAAEADTRAAAASLANVQVSIAAETAAAYIDLCALELRLSIARDNLASQEETLQIAQWRAQAGLTTSLDVEQARTSTELTRAQIPALGTSLAQAGSRLAILTGVTPEAMQSSLQAPAAVPIAGDDLALAFPAETLRQRPDVRLAEEKVSAAAARVTQADAARYPTFRLGGTLGVSALTLGGLSGGGALVSALLGSVSVPIYAGGALTAQVRAQEAALDQARIAYEAVVLTALKDVEDALVAVSTSRERLATLRRAGEAARNASLLARYRYNSGLIDFQSVLQTQVTLLSVQDGVANAQAALGVAHVQLYKALGGGWEPGSAAPTTPQTHGSTAPPATPVADGAATSATPEIRGTPATAAASTEGRS